jgi:ribose 5-phosphate isomerase B
MDFEPIGLASDHAGFELKRILKNELEQMARRVLDLGVGGTDPVDYPDFGYAMARALREKRVHTGVLICGSGIGISIAANRHPEVRAALVHDVRGARLARQHNDANVICFGGRTIDPEVARDCLRVFLSTEFEGGHHCPRVEKLSKPF